MKFLFDFFPILLFFVAYKLYDIYVATAVAIVAAAVQTCGRDHCYPSFAGTGCLDKRCGFESGVGLPDDSSWILDSCLNKPFYSP